MFQDFELFSTTFGPLRRITQCGLALFVSLLLLSRPMVSAQERVASSKVAQDVRALELGKPIERELKGGEVHVYQIALASGQYLHVVVDQRGIDVVVTLFGPDGRQLTEVDSPNGTQGPESVSLVAEDSGSYQLEVRPLENEAALGWYEVRIQDLRDATLQDRNRIAAEKAFEEGKQLHAQGTAEYLRKAIEKYEDALRLWRTAGDHQSEARMLNNIGYVYDQLGAIQEAINYYKQALPLLRAVGDSAALGGTFSNIAVVYNNLGEYQKALDHHYQALLIKRALGDRGEEAVTLLNLAVVYDNLGEPQKALDYSNEALQIFRGDSQDTAEGITLHNIGGIYADLGESQKALDYYRQALLLIKTEVSRAYTLNSIGSTYSDLGDNHKALEYYNQALPLSRAAGDLSMESTTLHNIGRVYADLGEKQKALAYLGQALQLSRVVREAKQQANTLYQIARVERDLGKLIEARNQIEAALDIIESLRTKVASSELRASYFASMQKYYEFYIDLLMQLHKHNPLEGHDAIALQFSERARARSLFEILTEAHADIRQGVDSILVARESTLQQQLNAKAERLTRLLSGKHTEEDSVAAQKELDSLLTQYQEVQAQIRASSPRYAALAQPQPLSAKEIQQQLLDDDTILLEYTLGKERSFLWALTPTTLNSFVLPKRAEIDSLARRVYDLLTARNQNLPNETEEQKEARIVQADKELLEASATLSQMLLGPVVKLLGNKRLLIVSDGALQYIPFGALPVPSTNGKSDGESIHQLVMDHEIASLPSASVLAVLRREMADRKPANKTVAVIADPVFASDDPRIKRSKIEAEKKAEEDTSLANQLTLVSALDRSVRQLGIADTRDGLHRLLFSRREAEGIMKLVPTNEGMKALDFKANRTTATNADLSQYRIVHFATHGLLNSEHPELSGIVLSLVDEKGKEQDGFLRLHEIYNLNLPADLVVLSACQTALGKEIKGEGLVGLTRGFMYAGAPRVVASLWSVQDDATAELMKRFYKKMLGEEKLRPAAALRAAQIEMWKTKRWQSPYYWAGFVLQGEWK